MAQPLRRDLGMHTGAQQIGRVGVPQPVEADRPDLGSRDDAGEHLGHAVRLDRVTVDPREHQSGRVAAHAEREPLGRLPSAVRLQLLHQRRRQCDRPAAALCLRCLEPKPCLRLLQRLRYGQRAAVQVDVATSASLRPRRDAMPVASARKMIGNMRVFRAAASKAALSAGSRALNLVALCPRPAHVFHRGWWGSGGAPAPASCHVEHPIVVHHRLRRQAARPSRRPLASACGVVCLDLHGLQLCQRDRAKCRDQDVAPRSPGIVAAFFGRRYAAPRPAIAAAIGRGHLARISIRAAVERRQDGAQLALCVALGTPDRLEPGDAAGRSRGSRRCHISVPMRRDRERGCDP